jgi:small subunit ribosomal protein S6
MFIFSPNSFARNPAGAAATVDSLVADNGGKMLASRLWHDQYKMAYPINGHRKGAYWLCYFEMEGDSQPKFNRAVKLTDQILRHMVISVDPRLVDSLVAVAKGETPAAEAEEATPEEPKEEAAAAAE